MADVSASTRGNLVIEIDRIYPADPVFEVKLETSVLIVTLFDLMFVLLLYVPVGSYGHCWTVFSPNHTYFLGQFVQAVNQYFMHILSFVTDNNPSRLIQQKGGE